MINQHGHLTNAHHSYWIKNKKAQSPLVSPFWSPPVRSSAPCGPTTTISLHRSGVPTSSHHQIWCPHAMPSSNLVKGQGLIPTPRSWTQSMVKEQGHVAPLEKPWPLGSSLQVGGGIRSRTTACAPPLANTGSGGGHYLCFVQPPTATIGTHCRSPKAKQERVRDEMELRAPPL